jgi:hypothetical protein
MFIGGKVIASAEARLKVNLQVKGGPKMLDFHLPEWGRFRHYPTRLNIWMYPPGPPKSA